MGVGVKLASEFYTTGEIVFYRSIIGVTIMWIMLRSQGISVRTPHMATHIKRSLFGVTALLLWFYLDHPAAVGHGHDAELHVAGLDRTDPGRQRGTGRHRRAARTAS